MNYSDLRIGSWRLYFGIHSSVPRSCVKKKIPRIGGIFKIIVAITVFRPSRERTRDWSAFYSQTRAKFSIALQF